MNNVTQEQKITVGSNSDKINVVTTCNNVNCTTVTTQEHDKFQFMSNLSSEKTRNLTEITRLTARNTEIDSLITTIQAL